MIDVDLPVWKLRAFRLRIHSGILHHKEPAKPRREMGSYKTLHDYPTDHDPDNGAANVMALGPPLIKRRASIAPSPGLELHWFRVAAPVRPRLRAAQMRDHRSAGRCGRVSG